jgi:TatD DNase family protein
MDATRQEGVMSALQSPPPLALWDAHCHLQVCRLQELAAQDNLCLSAMTFARQCGPLQDERIPAAEVAAVLAAAARCGVTRCVVNGCWPRDWARVLELAAAHPGVVIPQLGLHPWWVGRRGDGWLGQLRSLLQDHPEAGLGEVSGRSTAGPLTHFCAAAATPRPAPTPVGGTCSTNSHAWRRVQCGLDKSPRGLAAAPFDAQLASFEAQLALAQELRRPVSVHCVRAYGAVEEALGGAGVDVPAVLHAWTGSVESTRSLLRLPGVHFSLGGHLAKLPPQKAVPMVRAIPLDRLLLESDSPDGALRLGAAWLDALPSLRELEPRLAQFLERGNAPAAVACVLSLVAAARGEGEAAVAAAASANAERIFGDVAGQRWLHSGAGVG